MAQRIALITGTAFTLLHVYRANISGANSGVGLATTKVLARTDAFHVIMACRSLDSANNAKTELEQSGINPAHLSTVHLDVTDHESIREAASQVSQRFGQLDILVNNAAVAGLNALDDLTRRMRMCMDTNVIGPAVVSETFRPLLVKSPNAYSIYITSGVGSLTLAADPTSFTYRGPANGEAYRSSKSALNMVALQEWVHVQDTNTPLKIFMMCPGFVRSNLRGHSEEARSGWGHAGDPDVSGETVLSIVQGERDADVGKIVHKDGVYPW
ncbi:hypothetical protein EYZ11_006112 [Aspergillus tanneri]|uniref:Uncharacterized protein n=1 Tax=Aspergillus tanneri TaxID=1220188 RepID=A0A4S3JGV3_9EURO|nr:uncharacterized protein ATNIH1004_003926 [Aspergillus tanneri]KAA8648043.1 hypothetical protein ATNIH1004_003926 [Aspergillus tanneri]THC94415.1 hypothetical protein EYZ11_006112 [Aspergillus tanneri]